ncbi:MAG TPA: type IV toxin-antitoxin system AbiEi family antitoxin [Candidatus Limnocylindria bacterium]|nr:type IV toxin-antitoxin system AbiEi family antitoxin [Candidatus Limnocylindria bacterium]
MERGLIRRVCAGAYVDAALPDTLETRTAALALVVPAGSVVCRSTAAWVHGVDALPSGSHERVPDVEMAVPEGAAATRRPGVRAYVEQMSADEVVHVNGVPVTTPVRTAADLGRWLPRYHAIGVLDRFLRNGLVTRSQLRTEVDRWTGYRGVRQLRDLVELADGRSESPRESWLRLLIIDSGFPDPVPQYEVPRGPGLVPYRLDLAWPDLMVAVEYDGAEAHGPAQAKRDAARRRFLRQLGWSVIVVRRGDLERPDRAVLAIGQFVTPVRRPRRGAKAA